MRMLLELMEERQKWMGKRDESIREISRLSDIIRATMNMIPPEQLARYEPIFERIEQRPLGLSAAIRACFTVARAPEGLVGIAWRMAESGKSCRSDADSAEKLWLTPVEIRDRLKNMGFHFENYKANPLASIHTTLKRMVPAEMEVKTLKGGQKIYRLKSAGDWAQAFTEVHDWMKDQVASRIFGATAAGTEQSAIQQEKTDQQPQQPPQGTKNGPSGSA